MRFRTQEEIIAVLREYKNSVETLPAFSRRKELNVNTMRTWIKKANLPIRNAFKKCLDWEFIKSQL